MAEFVGHLCDGERIFAYRILVIARNDPTLLASFDQDAYVQEAGYDQCRLPDLLEEFAALRETTLRAFQHITPAISLRRGQVNGGPFTVRALLDTMAGHVYHHLASLEQNYLAPLGQRAAIPPH